MDLNVRTDAVTRAGGLTGEGGSEPAQPAKASQRSGSLDV